MSMEINNTYGNYGTSADSKTAKNESTASETERYSNATEYAEVLARKYDCVKSGNVAISGAYLAKCVNDPEKAKKLEENLSLYKEIYDHAYQSAQRTAAANGGTVTSYSMTWNVDSKGNISMIGMTTVRTETGAKSIKEIRENLNELLKEKREAEKKEREEKLTEHRENRRTGSSDDKYGKRKKYDEVVFSKEGYENYRKGVSENGKAMSYENIARQKKVLSDGIDYSYNLSKEADKLNKADEEALTDGDTLSRQTKRDNLDKAYQNLRDEIMQGYENGTRQVNVTDKSSETGYRTLTMEEELSALEAAYEKSVKGFEELADQQQKAETIIDEWQEQVADIKEGKNSDESVERQEDEEESEKTEEQSGMVGINAGKLARMLAAAKTRSQVQAVMAKIQSDLQECEAGRNNGMDVDEESVKAAEQLLQEAKSRMSSAENREATPEEEMAAALASLM